jgi:hypothetical protein
MLQCTQEKSLSSALYVIWPSQGKETLSDTFKYTKELSFMSVMLANHVQCSEVTKSQVFPVSKWIPFGFVFHKSVAVCLTV